MRSIRVVLLRCADLVRARRRDSRLDDEVRLHLELLAGDLEAGGLPPDRAREEARRRFGGVDQMKMRYRDQRGLPLLDALRQDVAFGLRLLARDRSLSLSIVVALALGIGSTVTVFTILNAMLLRDVPFFRDPDRVMAIDSMDGRGRRVGVSFDDYLDWSGASSFSGLSAYAGANAVLADGDRPADRLNGVYVSAGTFELLGAVPALGRAFQPADDRRGAELVVVLAHGLWAERFGGDPGAIGRPVRVNGTSAMVIGVMPPGFSFPLTGDLWIPLVHMPGMAAAGRERRVLAVVGRLADGVSLASGRAELAALSEGLAAEHPATNAGVRPVIVPFVSRYLGSFTTPEPLMLLGAAVVLLLIACANASTLLLTRAAVRAREIALRATIGASRARIVGQLLVESVLLASVSGLCGLALAAGAVRAFASTTGELGLPAWTRFELDGRVFAFAALVCLGTGLVFGCAPALHLSRRATPLALRDGGRGLAGAARPGLRMRLLLATQVALAVILLAGATNLVVRARGLYMADQALEPAGVLTGRVAVPEVGYADAAARARLVTALRDRLAALPGVLSSGVASTLPFVGAGTARLHFEGAEGEADDGPPVCTVGIAGDYLETLKLRLLAGHAPNDLEAQTALVNQAFVDAMANGTTPVGRRIRLARSGSAGLGPTLTIVGVVPSVRQTPLGDARPCVYLPLVEEPGFSLAVLLRTSGAAAASAPAVRAALHDLDADLALYNVHALDELSHIVRWSSRTISVVLAVFGLIAFALSISGLYAVTAREVTQRTQEIGVHLTLGARTLDVWRLVAGRAAPVVAAGLVLGTAGGAGLTRAMRGLLIGPDGGGPLVLAGLAVVVLSVALLACAIPTRRALRLEPGAALRVE
jgi:putative ABC transport system permease protein